MERNHYKIAGLSLFIFFAVICIAQPSTANAQQKIAFSTDRNGNSEIYLMNANGTNPVNLSNNPAFDATPSLSPKGNKIAFTSQRNGRFDVYTMNLDGSNQTNLTSNIGTSNFHPSYSWDGNKIVFVSNNSNGTAEILMMNADGSNPVFLGGVQSARDPSFSPDGSKVVFGGNIFGQYDIYVVSTAGSNPIPLTGDPAADIEPSFSPDGNKIAFTSARDGNEEIYLMNADGSNQVRLTQNAGVDTSPIYSPDGTKIAFSSDRPSGWDICVINLDGTNQVPLTSSPGFSNTSPSWRDLTFAPPGFINIEVTSEINEGGTATLSGGISNFDPSQSISLTINWGDGSEEMFNYPAGTNAFSKTHQYAENLFDLPYTVNATVSTANGSDSATDFVVVNNVAPTLAAVQPPSAVIGSPLKLSGTVSDPGTLDTHAVNINWGDGSSVATLNLAAGATNFSANHTYATLGAYTINVSASDDDGGTATPQNIFLGVVPQPTSGKIAFTSNFGGNNNIWLMNSNGTNQIALTTNSASDSYPNLSKDGTKIVFISDRDGNPEIYTMNAAGAFQTRLTNTAGTESEPVFSPDGSKIVFASNRDGNHEIYIMNADGTGQTRLTTNTVDDGQAEFSPDGTKIIFSRLAANQTDAHIWTMDLNGANPVALTSGSFVLNGYPSYSPNGQKIVFSSVRPLSHTNAEIYLMDANGANQVRVTTAAGNDMEPVFSPAGTKIAFRSERDGSAEIYLMDSNGTNQQRITFDGAGVTNFAPSWATVPTLTVDIADDLAREQGSTLTVPIIVSDTTGKGIISYDFALNFDPAVLQPLGVAFDKIGTLSSGFEVNSGTGTPGKVVISGFGSAPLTGAGTLLNLKFNVIGTPPTSSDLVLDPFVFNEGIPFVDVSAGRVFVQGTIRGSVLYGTSATPLGVPGVLLSAAGTPATSATTGADGSYVLGGFGPGSYTVTPTKVGGVNGITALDASLVSQFLVGATNLSNNQQAAGEVSGNGSLTSFDAALIAQYVVSLPNTGITGQWRFAPPSRFYATVGSLTGENFVGILMGEVSGNWSQGAGGSFSGLRTTDSAISTKLQQSARKPLPAVTLTLPSIKAKTGDVVTIGVTLSQLSSTLQAYQFDVLYDPQVLQPDATPANTTGTLSNSLAAVTNAQTPGRIRLAVYGSNLISSNGTLINLRFRVNGANGTSSSLSFVNLMLNEGFPAAEGKSGKVTVAKR